MPFNEEEKEALKKVMVLINQKVETEEECLNLFVQVITICVKEAERVGISEERTISALVGVTFGIVYDCLGPELFKQYIEASSKWYIDHEGGYK